MTKTIKQIVSRVANRVLVRNVACPECGATPGTKCQGVRHPRTANHQSRWDAYREQQTQTNNTKE